MNWYALRVKPHKEATVQKRLQARQLAEVYYPSLTHPRSKKEKPYFPGYLFIKADLQALGRNVFEWLPGARGLVRFGDEAAVVPDYLIRDLQKQIGALRAQATKPVFQQGERVRIVEGPLQGYEAIFNVHLSSKDRVQVLLAFLSNHPQPIELSAEHIRKLD